MKQEWRKFSESISSGAMLSLGIQLFGFALAFLLSLVLTNLYGDEVYGDYVLVFSSLDILAVFALFGYNQLFARFLPQWNDKREKQAALYHHARRRTVLIAMLLALLLMLLAVFYPFQDKAVCDLLLAGAITLPLLAIANLQTAFLYSIRVHVWPQINEKILRPLLFILLILLLFWSQIETNHLALAFMASTLVSFVLLVFLKRRHFLSPKLTTSYQFTDEQKAISLLVLINIINVIFSKTDTFMVGYYLGAEFSGVNNIYMKITSSMLLAMSGLMLASSPHIAENLAAGKPDLVRTEIKRVLRFSFLAATALFVGMLLLGPWFFGLYASPLFGENIDAMYIYGLCNFVNLFTGPATVVLLLSNQLRYLIYGYLFELVLNVALNTWLIPQFNIQGAAWATLISEGLVNAYFAYICFKTLRVNTLLIGKT